MRASAELSKKKQNQYHIRPKLIAKGRIDQVLVQLAIWLNYTLSQPYFRSASLKFQGVGKLPQASRRKPRAFSVVRLTDRLFWIIRLCSGSARDLLRICSG